ncbi:MULTISPECIES: hypothetical protein [Acidithiobacillus]|uniref:hypothetical protein n=1 Tax=Acidithiobacillus TaxID=119977 RepID=UPI000A3F4357|nr:MULTISPECIES: hypothetical protein [Acidithiobacillus]MCR2830249.1 hypothetical protein [Acidithiobacillus ferrooxidans]MDX5934603.1 hypothetical protein [Acidithiobacillus thiooxidans]
MTDLKQSNAVSEPKNLPFSPSLGSRVVIKYERPDIKKLGILCQTTPVTIQFFRNQLQDCSKQQDIYNYSVGYGHSFIIRCGKIMIPAGG